MRTATVVLDTPPQAIPADAIARAAAILRAGGLVAFPTETVYGLGANALDARAVAAIFVAKGRPSHNPLIVHVAGPAEARELVTDWPDCTDLLIAHFWPGPLSLVLPRAPLVPDAVTGGGNTVAIRMPAHPVALRLLQEAGIPLAAPSANRSNQLSPTRAEHVLRDLDGRIDLILDGGPTPGGIESTVLDLTHRPPRLLRPGLVTPGEIEAVIGPIDSPGGQASALAGLAPLSRSGRGVGGEGAPLPSPGMMSRHYAPRTPLEAVPGDARERVLELVRQGRRIGWITHRAKEPLRLVEVVEVVLPDDPAAYAAALYHTLHQLDAAGLDRIVVEWPPEGEEWLGIRDRLRRAAQPGAP
jgi:L-threonylcarbamoyladenylate synthase